MTARERAVIAKFSSYNKRLSERLLRIRILKISNEKPIDECKTRKTIKDGYIFDGFCFLKMGKLKIY